MNDAALIVIGLSGAVIALVTLVVWVNRRQIAKRRAALESVAQQAGWSLAHADVEPAALDAGTVPLFARGRDRRARNVMRTSDQAMKTAVFDYRYTVGSGKHQSTSEQTVVHIRSPRLSLPAFVLGPENVLHKLGAIFGYHDIDFDSSPEFSKKYLLRGAAEEARVRELFSPSLRIYFEQRPEMVTVEANGSDVLVYRSARTVQAGDLRPFVEDAQAIARHLER